MDATGQDQSRSTNPGQDQDQGHVQGQVFGTGYNLDGNTNGFNMEWSGANTFNPMMQMQSGMQPFNWNGFPNMMGKSTLTISFQEVLWLTFLVQICLA